MEPAVRHCPNCRAILAADSPQGLCASCLLKGVLSPSATTLDLSGGVTSSPAPANPATRLRYFGDYELIDEVARGGMGVVYRARQVSLNRVVAVKMILSGQFASDAEVKRFRVEAEAAANLQHPHIVAIHEIGEHDSRHYFSMDFIEGKNLLEHTLARPQPFSARDIATLVKTLTEAVHYAHQRGTLHRDLKPQNVLIDAQGRPHITDFGLAKRWEAPAATAPARATIGGASTTDGATSPQPANGSPPTSGESGASGSSDLTRTGAIMGSPSYMAPEQAAGKLGDIGPATDVYSLGAILYQLLTGQPPHRGNTALETLRKVVDEDPLPPSNLRPDVPEDLETICLKCLEKHPERRYAIARQLAEELDRFLGGEPILAKPASPWRKIWSVASRHPWIITGLVSLAILGLSLLTYGLWEKTRYMAWLAAHPRQVPVTYWVRMVERELPVGALLPLGMASIFSALYSFGDLRYRRAAGARLGRTRLGIHLAIILGFLAGWFYITAKVVKIGVWTDAPMILIVPLLLYLQPMLWGGLQFLWQWVRTIQTNQSGLEPPRDFLTIESPKALKIEGPFSLWRTWRADQINQSVRWRESGMKTSAIHFGRALLVTLVALAAASFWLGPGQKVGWTISAFIIAVFVYLVAGAINPRWTTGTQTTTATHPGADRFGHVTGALSIFAAFSLYAAIVSPEVLPKALPPVPIRAIPIGLVTGILLVYGYNLSRRVATEASFPEKKGPLSPSGSNNL